MTNQMKMPKFDNVFTIGNVIMLVTIIAGGLWFQATTLAQQRAFQDKVLGEINRIEENVRAAQNARVEQEARVRALELGAGRVDERLTNITSILTRIERQLETRP